MKGDKYAVTSVGMTWCIVNTRTHVKKVIGPIKMKGSNNFDKAKELAAKRMGVSTDEVEYIPNYFNKIRG